MAWIIIGHKLSTEAVGYIICCISVGEHSNVEEGRTASRSGDFRSANVGISNDKGGENPPRRKTKVS